MISLSDTELREQNKKNLEAPGGENPEHVRIFTELDRRYKKLFGPSPKEISTQIEYYRRRFAFTMTDKDLEEHYRKSTGRSKDDKLWKQYFEEELNRRKDYKNGKEKNLRLNPQK